MKFVEIGTGWVKQSAKGTSFIAITIVPEQLKRVYEADYRKFCLFKNKFRKSNQPEYLLYAPVEEETEHEHS